MDTNLLYFLYLNQKQAKTYFHSGDIDRSEFFWKKSLELKEDHESHFYLGLIKSQKKNLIEALTHFYKAFELNSEYGNPCNEIGVILLRAGLDKEAMYWLKKSVRAKKNDAPHIPLYNLAALYKIWNRPERSLQYLHKALHYKPNFNEAIKLKNELLSL